jgi:hypothetical protein
MAAAASYHDLHITLRGRERASIFDLPLTFVVLCARVSGWEVWDTHNNPDTARWELLGGEYDSEKPLRLDVNGEVVVDSFPKETT